MKNCRFVLGIALALGLIQAAQPKTWYVAPPPDGADSGHDGTSSWDQAFATISNAIVKSASGDTVLVTNGTYVLSAYLDIAKTIDLRSVNGPELTIIDGSNAVKCVYFQNTAVGSSTNTKIQGFTIRNGYDSAGAAVRVRRRGATIHNCVIESSGGSAAVYIRSDTAANEESTLITSTRIQNNRNGGMDIGRDNVTLRDCTIAANNGIGLWMSLLPAATNRWIDACTIAYNTNTSFASGVSMGGSAVFTNCLIANNTATRGAGIYGIAGPTGQFYACTIASNRASLEGGGGYIGFSADFAQCRIVGNRSDSKGGGLDIVNTVPDRVTLTNCRILDNYAAVGGGICDEHGAVLYNCLIAGNSSGTNSTDRGGGINFAAAALTGEYWNCTITSNAALSATGEGGGLWVGGEVRLINTILYGNSAGMASSNWFRNSGILYATNCCVAPAAGVGLEGGNNFDSDPLFINPAGANFRLSPGSSCINSGLNQAWMSQATDLDGRPRLDRLNRMVDLGCFEYIFPGTFFSVK